VTTLIILAAAGDSGGLGDVGPFVNLGAIGVLCVALITFARTAYQREVKRADACQQDLEELNKELRTSVVPAMVEVNRTMTRVIALLDESRR
jgi:hypothetical protein